MDDNRRRHIIHRQTFDLEVGDRLQGREIHQIISKVYHERILPVIEEIFDELSVPGHVIRIDRLDLDLGKLDYNNLEYDIERKIRFELKNKIIEARAVAEKIAFTHSSSFEGARLIPIGPMRLEALSYFLLYGRLKPGMDIDQTDLDEFLLDMIQKDPKGTASVLRKASRTNPAVVKRLVSQFNPESQERVYQLLVPKEAALIRTFINKMNRDVQAKTGLNQSDFQETVRESIMKYLLSPSGATFKPQGLIESAEQILTERTGTPILVLFGSDALSEQTARLKKRDPKELTEQLSKILSGDTKVDLQNWQISELFDWVVKQHPREWVDQLRKLSGSNRQKVIARITKEVTPELLKKLLAEISPGRTNFIQRMTKEFEESLTELKQRSGGKSSVAVTRLFYESVIDQLLAQPSSSPDLKKVRKEIEKDLAKKMGGDVPKVEKILDRIMTKAEGTGKTKEETERDERAKESRERPEQREPGERSPEKALQKAQMSEQARMDVAIHFLLHGELPWWAEDVKTADLETMLRPLLMTSPKIVKSSFQELSGYVPAREIAPAIAERLTGQFSEDFLQTLVEALEPDFFGFIQTLVVALEKVWDVEAVRSKITFNTAKSWRWAPVMVALLRNEETETSVTDWIKMVLEAAAEGLGGDKELLLKEVTQLARKASNAGESRFGPLANILGMQGRQLLGLESQGDGIISFGPSISITPGPIEGLDPDTKAQTDTPEGEESKAREGKEEDVESVHSDQEREKDADHVVEDQAADSPTSTETEDERAKDAETAEPSIDRPQDDSPTDPTTEKTPADESSAKEVDKDLKSVSKEEQGPEATQDELSEKDSALTLEDAPETGPESKAIDSDSEEIDTESVTSPESQEEKGKTERPSDDSETKDSTPSEAQADTEDAPEDSAPLEQDPIGPDPAASEEDSRPDGKSEPASDETASEETAKPVADGEAEKEEIDSETENKGAENSPAGQENDKVTDDLPKVAALQSMPDEQIFLWFLNHGSLPLGAGNLSRKDFIAITDKLLDEEPKDFRKTLNKLVRRDNIIERVVAQLSTEVMEKMIRTTTPSHAQSILQHVKGMVRVFALATSPAKVERIWEHAILFSVAEVGDGFGTYRYLTTLVRYLMRRDATDIREVVNWLVSVTKQIPPDIQKGITESLAVLQKGISRTGPVETEEEGPEEVEVELPNPPKKSEPVYVKNAGVVLLWPFIHALFKNLELMDPLNNWISAQKRARGPHLLQYCVDKSEGRPEYEMTLHKVLCGIPLNLPIGRVKLTDAEKEMCDKLLDAVCQQWEPMKSSTGDALRGTFLIREGKLLHKNGKWFLTVEQKSLDMLLDMLTWGMAIIKTGWMEEPLMVTWR